MAAPTEAEIQAQISAAVNVGEKTRLYGHVNSPNFLALLDTLVEAQENDFPADVGNGIAAVRSAFNSAMTNVAGMITPLLRQYAKFLDTPEQDVQSIFSRLYDDFVDNSKTVNSRGFVFGSVTAGGGNVGDGVIHQLTTDANSFDIEATTPETKTFECLQDEHSGAVEHEEVFEARGANAEQDFIEITGSGKKESLKASSARDSQALLGNPSFSQFSGTSITALTSIVNWTETTAIGNFELNESVTYRGFEGDTTPRSVRFLTNDTLTQNLNVRRAQLDPAVPYYLQVAVNRNGEGTDGAFTLTLGGVTASIADLTAIAASGWVILRIAVGADNWFENFNQEDLSVSLALSGRTTGTLYVDDVVFVPYTPFDGLWYVAVGGATPFLRDDIFTASNTVASDSVLQQHFWRYFGRYLPSNDAGGETWVDPT